MVTDFLGEGAAAVLKNAKLAGALGLGISADEVGKDAIHPADNLSKDSNDAQKLFNEQLKKWQKVRNREATRGLENEAKKLGVKHADYDGNVELGTRVNKAIKHLKNSGLIKEEHLKRLSIYSSPEEFIKSKNPSALGVYNPVKYNIKFNAAQKTRYLENRIKKNFQTEYFSTGNIYHPIFHEFGHFQHHMNLLENSGKFIDFFALDKKIFADVTSLSDSEIVIKNYIRNEVSGRASENLKEFYAEVFTGKVFGHEYDNEINKIYHKIGGKN